MSQLVLDWVKQNNVMNTLTDNNYPKAACDDSGNIYVTYQTTGTASGGQSTGANDIVVFKMNSSGTVQWVRQTSTMNTNLADNYPTIACDTTGNLYVAYYTSGGTASGNKNTGVSYDIVVFKMDSSGSVQWVRQNSTMNTSGDDYYPTIACDTLGNLYVVYQTTGTSSGGQKLGGTSYDIVVLKMDSSGSVQWVRQNSTMNTSGDDYFPTIACDAAGNLYVAYYTSGTSSGGQKLGGTSYDIVVFKMDSSGTVQWVCQNSTMNTSFDDNYPTIACDTAGNLYVAYHTFGGTASGGQNTGSNDIVVFKMNSSGTVQWVRQNSTMNTNLSDNYPMIACDASGNLYVAYYTTGTSSGGQNTGSNDIVVFKMDTMGSVLWVRQDPILNTYRDESFPFIVFNNNNIYLVYHTKGMVNGQLHTTPSRDIVVTKMTQSGIFTQAIQELVMNTDTNDITPSITYDNSGNIYITYSTTGTTSGEKNTGASSDIVVFKINSSGTVQWVRQNAMMNTSATDNTPSIMCDASGYLYVAYQTTGTTSGEKNTGASYDIVVFKMDSSGTVQWVRQNAMMNTSAADSNASITCDSVGNLYVAYHTNTGTASGAKNIGSFDIVVFKMDSSGTVQWVRQNATMNTSATDYSPRITCDATGYLYVAYHTTGTASGEKNTGLSSDIVVFKMDSSGTVQWVRQNAMINTSGSDSNASITCDTVGNLYITYNTNGTASGETNTGLSNDIVVFKMDSSGTVQWVRQNAMMNTSGIEQISAVKAIPSGDLVMTYTTDRTVGNVNYGGINNDIVVAKLRELPLFPPQVTQSVSLSNYLSSAASSITSANKQLLKDYILQNRSSFASPVANISGSIIAKLIDTQVNSYNVASVSSVLTILPITDGQTTSAPVNITSQLTGGSMGIYFFGSRGFVHTIQIQDKVYSFTMTDTGLIFNGIAYGLGDNVPFGSYRLAIKYLGSVGGELTQIAPAPPAETGTNVSYQSLYSSFTAGTTITGERVAIVSPFAGNYTGTSEANIGVTDMTNQQYFTGIDAVFEKTLTENDVIQLLNTFRVRDTNVNLGPGLIDGSITAGGTYSPPPTAQDYANFDVDLVNTVDFKSVLSSIMTTANQVTGKLLPNITAYFQEEMRVEMNLQLKNSGLLDMLEASNVTGVVVDLDINGGSQSMITAICTDIPGTTIVADKRRQFLTQIPLETLNQYLAEAQREIHYLPLKGGDSVTFVFDVTVQAPSSLSTITNNIYDANGNINQGNSPYKSIVGNIHMDSERRRVAFVVNLTDKNTYFRRDFASVTAAGAPVITNIADAKRYVKEQTQYLTMYGPSYVSDLLAATVTTPFTSAEWIAQAKYELARDEQAAYASSGSYTSHITSINPSA